MPPHIFIYLFLFYRQPHIFIFHLVCYISKCLRVETSFWTRGCTHTPAKCQSSYMSKKCIASNLITTCRVLIKKKNLIFFQCEGERYFLLVSSFYIFLRLCYPFIPQFDFLLQFVCSVLLIKTCNEGESRRYRQLFTITVTQHIDYPSGKQNKLFWNSLISSKERYLFFLFFLIRPLIWFLLCCGL